MNKFTLPCTVAFRPRSAMSIIAVSIAAFALLVAPHTRAADAIFSSVSLGGGNQDANVGLNSLEVYNSAANLGGGALTINGVSFEGSGVGNTINGTNYSLSGAGAGPFTGYTSGAGGQIGAMLSDFVYNGDPATLTLSGLTVGQSYIFTSYNAQFGGAGERVHTVSASSGASTVYDQNLATGLNLLRYTFTASATTEALTFLPKVSANTWHFYGISNETVFSNAWSAGSNWTTATWGAAGVPNAVGANAYFTAQGSPTTINLDANQIAGHVSLGGTNAWTLSGTNTLTLQADVGGISVLSTPSGTHTISAPVALSSDVIKSGPGTLVLAGAVTGNGKNVTLGGGTLEFSNSAQTLNASVSGPGALAKSGAGTLTLTGALSYTGATTIGGGGTLDIANTSTTRFTSVIGGGGSLTKSGAGPLLLTTTNTYSGGTTISVGTLASVVSNATGTGPLTVVQGASWELGGESQTVAGLMGGGNVTRSTTRTTTPNTALSTGIDGAILISPSKTYVQKLDFGNNGGATVNGVAFTSGTTSGPNFTLATATTTYANDSGSGYDQLMSDFQYGYGGGTTPSELTFTGLTSGSLYDITLYTQSIYTQVGLWGGRPQNAIFASGSNTQTMQAIDPGTVGYFSFKFVADGTSASVNMTPQISGASFHWFGATLESIASLESNDTPLTVGDSGNYTFSGVISGQTSLVKQGSGTQILSGANTYTGLTTVVAGTLLVNGSISGAVSVQSGGTLGGSGTVGAVSVLGGGIVAPGAAGVGTLNTGDFSLASTSVLKFELANPGIVGSGTNDLLSVTGALTLAGTLQVTELLNFGEGTYRLFDYTGGLTNNTLAIEASFLLAHPGSYIDTATANQVNLMVVPEPGAAISLLGGLGLLLVLRRRRTGYAV